MLMLDATLVSTDQPSLEQRGDEVDAGMTSCAGSEPPLRTVT